MQKKIAKNIIAGLQAKSLNLEVLWVANLQLFEKKNYFTTSTICGSERTTFVVYSFSWKIQSVGTSTIRLWIKLFRRKWVVLSIFFDALLRNVSTCCLPHQWCQMKAKNGTDARNRLRTSLFWGCLNSFYSRV